jgi:hypothetical protein
MYATTNIRRWRIPEYSGTKVIERGMTTEARIAMTSRTRIGRLEALFPSTTATMPNAKAKPIAVAAKEWI